MTGTEIATWTGIVLCLSQSAMFSGLNLAFFSISRLRLEAEAEQGRAAARKILALRRDANFLLCTILWGNVSVNVLLAWARCSRPSSGSIRSSFSPSRSRAPSSSICGSGPNFMRERDVEVILQKHIREEDSEIGAAEGRGALNFLDLDDRLVAHEGRPCSPFPPGSTCLRCPKREANRIRPSSTP